ncbi:MAG TPA: SIS domain-containing protein [Chloroflexota bacterium]|nr:SIS domain-containing protein [Chloroflexota bacterium]
MIGEKALGWGIAEYLNGVAGLLGALPADSLARTINRLEEARCKQQLVFTCGNGGSATTAIHFASDLAKGAATPNRPGFRSMSLCDNIAMVTAWANDSSYADIFSRRLTTWASRGDVLVAISGSGRSPNVLDAIRVARAAGCTTIGFTGFEGGRMKDMVDICVTVPSDSMEQIEDVHLVLCHLITKCLRALPLETALHPGPNGSNVIAVAQDVVWPPADVEEAAPEHGNWHLSLPSLAVGEQPERV